MKTSEKPELQLERLREEALKMYHESGTHRLILPYRDGSATFDIETFCISVLVPGKKKPVVVSHPQARLVAVDYREAN
jgi:hypothetical protein